MTIRMVPDIGSPLTVVGIDLLADDERFQRVEQFTE